jgi:hypothetical protein
MAIGGEAIPLQRDHRMLYFGKAHIACGVGRQVRSPLASPDGDVEGDAEGRAASDAPHTPNELAVLGPYSYRSSGS